MYLTITKILEQTEAGISAAEAHGMATGMLCVNSLTTANTWLQELFSNEPELIDSERHPLVRLFEQTQQVLTIGDFEFELLLPDDETLLSTRADALRHWCLGYLAGIGSSHYRHDWPGEGAEIIKDIVAISRLDCDIESEEDEVALVELHEYIRVSVQVFREALLTVSSSNTVH